MVLKPNWYAARTGANQELSIQRKFSDLQMETFVPTLESIRIRNGKKRHCDRPALPNIVFVKADKESAYRAINEHGLRVKYMIDSITRKALIIPDKQMEDFVKVMLHYNDRDVILSSGDFQPGDMVRITSGPFAGVEGMLGSDNNKNTVSIHINGIITVSVHLNRDTITKLNQPG